MSGMIDPNLVGVKRLFEKTVLNPDTMCMEYTGALNDTGYGRVVYYKNGSTYTMGAHRVAYWKYYGVDPKELFVCHKCDTPRCVNPHHLFLGTNRDNIRDSLLKGRRSSRVGVNNGRAVVDEDMVVEMRRRYGEGGVTQVKLAEEYGIYQTQVSRIIRGEAWSHIPCEG